MLNRTLLVLYWPVFSLGGHSSLESLRWLRAVFRGDFYD